MFCTTLVEDEVGGDVVEVEDEVAGDVEGASVCTAMSCGGLPAALKSSTALLSIAR